MNVSGPWSVVSRKDRKAMRLLGWLAGATGLLLSASCLAAEPGPSAQYSALSRIDGVVQKALERGELPGAVVLIVHRGQVVFRKAYGLRSKLAAAVPMTADTV